MTVSIASVALALNSGNAAIAQTLTGADTSFANSLYQRYFSEYEKEKGDRVRYGLISKTDAMHGTHWVFNRT